MEEPEVREIVERKLASRASERDSPQPPILSEPSQSSPTNQPKKTIRLYGKHNLSHSQIN
ncbi:MAG: hypothetical protein AB4426_09770 [Xenococcaceae cyanobacterium]